ncbi:hypothetical protein [Caulobacter soli]|uniref:hypothetical protein n=1 Tax=Caulobacter soli TaxID=2708539 RepID=UPI0013EC50C8|nr:hypothetical protein [Caulobacter soli]
MLLSVILLAAAVQAAPAAPALGDQIAPNRARFYPSGRDAFEVAKAQEGCRAPGVDLAVNAAPAIRAAVQKLGDLPPANHTLTVLRSIDGCPVSSTVRFNVDRPAGR